MTFIMRLNNSSFYIVLYDLIFSKLYFFYNEGCLTYIFPDIFGSFWITGFNLLQWGQVLFLLAYLNIFLNKANLAI